VNLEGDKGKAAVWGIHVVSPEEEKEGCDGRICRKGRF